MKSVLIYTTLALLCLAPVTSAQNFAYYASDTLLMGTVTTPPALTQFVSYIYNDESTPLTFWVHEDKNIPPDWDATFCTTVCWAPFVVDDSNYVIAGNESDTVLVDIYPGPTGTDGWVTISVMPLGYLGMPESITFHCYTALGVKGSSAEPQSFTLLTVYPNPFNSTVSLSFTLARPEQIDLSIYDLSGRLVERIFAGQADAGHHHMDWQAGNLASGVYLAKLTQGETAQISKVVYLR